MNRNVELKAYSEEDLTPGATEATVIVHCGVYGASATFYISSDQAISFAHRLMSAAEEADRVTAAAMVVA